MGAGTIALLARRATQGIACLLAMAGQPVSASPLSNEQYILQVVDRAVLLRYPERAQVGVPNNAACLQEMESVRALALQVAATLSGYAREYILCATDFAGPAQQTLTEPELRARFEQFVLPLRAATHPVARPGELDIQAEIHYLRLGQTVGLSAPTEARFHAMLSSRLAYLHEHPDDPETNRDLKIIVSMMYGGWQFQEQIVRTHQLISDSLGESHTLTLKLARALAYHERFMGQTDRALEYISRAAELARQHHADDVELQAHMATEWAACLGTAGRLDEALPKLLQARDYFESRQPPQWTNIVRTNYNLAGVAFDSGDYDAAIKHARRAIDYAKRSADPLLSDMEIVVPATIMETAKLAQGDVTAAERLKEALLIPKGPEMHIGSPAFSLVRDAYRRHDTAMLRWSSEFADKHIQQFRSPLQAESALRPLMQAWTQSDGQLDNTELRQPLERATVIALGGQSPSILALCYFNLAAHFSATRPSLAVWLYKHAGVLLQEIRQGLPTDDQDAYRSWLSGYETELRAFIALLIEQGRLPEAEQVLNVLRDEELFEYTRRSQRGKVHTARHGSLSFTPAEQALNPFIPMLSADAKAAASAAHQRLSALRRTYLRGTYHDPDADKAVDDLTSRFDTALASAFPPDTSRKASLVPSNIAVPAHSARISYLIDRQGIEILVATPGALKRFRSDVAISELHQTLQAARGALTNPQVNPEKPLNSLWRWLIAPALGHLRAHKIRTLIMVPDGALRYVPMSALFDGKHYLVERFALHTALVHRADQVDQAIQLVPRDAKSVSLLAMGRTLGDAQHAALPGVFEEIQAAALTAGEHHLDTDFTAQTLSQGLALKPDVVHIASHFVLDPAGEDKSYLLLGDGEHLSLNRLKELPWRGVSLAVLSACDSATAIDKGDGREWTGFASSLTDAGVRNVLAALWRIDDKSTAALMTRFYQRLHRQRGALPTATMLAGVQRGWLRRHRGNATAHPHYWAPFVWLGQ